MVLCRQCFITFVHYNLLFLFQGDPLPDVVWPQHTVAQVTGLAWHPTKKLLVTGWENGELRVWAGDSEFISVQSVHQAPITILRWSNLGGRLVSGDAVCVVTHIPVL
jgi:intraflagellar transport protein 140